MEDVAPGLLKQIQGEYRRRIQASKVLAEYEQDIKAGRADYEGAAEAARELGEILAAVYQNQLSSEVLPDGKMYYNIALRILDPTMKENYENAADYAEAAQKILNENAGLGVKAIRPALNQDAIDGLVNRISSEEQFDEIKWILNAPVKTFTQKVVDESVRKNAEFHYKAGLKPKIVRKSSGKCCAWCSKMAGVYSYPDVPKDVYRRHDNCNCTVEYDPGSGKRQNVWSKQWKYEAEPTIIEERKKIGIQQLAAQLAAHPKRLASYTPDKIKDTFEKEGYEIKPLGRGNLKGIPFEEGGGFRISYDGDKYFQYHPESRSHHKGAYYKIADGTNGTRRYDMKGEEIDG